MEYADELRKKSIILAERLKALREEKGLSLEKLSELIEDRYGIRISTTSLINYEVATPERIKLYKNLGMRTEYLYVFSDLYGVSTDYLLGLTDIRSADSSVQSIVNSTGLSEDSVITLLNPSNIPNDRMIVFFRDFVNSAIRFGNNYSLICDYSELSSKSDLDPLVESIDTTIRQLENLPSTAGAIQALKEFNEIILWNRNRNLTPRFYAKTISDKFESYLLTNSLYDDN